MQRHCNILLLKQQYFFKTIHINLIFKINQNSKNPHKKGHRKGVPCALGMNEYKFLKISRNCFPNRIKFFPNKMENFPNRFFYLEKYQKILFILIIFHRPLNLTKDINFI